MRYIVRRPPRDPVPRPALEHFGNRSKARSRLERLEHETRFEARFEARFEVLFEARFEARF